MPDPVVTRIMGGSPLTVLIRLAVVSLVVGALMSWLQVDLADLAQAVERAFTQFWGTGFEAVVRIGRTALGGAALVVPVWLLIRLLSFRRPPRREPDIARASRWSDRIGDERRP